MNNRPKIFRVSYLEALTLIYLIIFNIRYLTNLNVMVVLGLWCAIGLIIYVYVFMNYPYMRKTMLLYFIVDLWALVGLLVNKNHPWQYFLVLITLEAFGITLYLLKNRLKLIDVWALATLTYIGGRILFMRFTDANFLYEKAKLSELLGCNTASILAIFLMFLDFLYCRSIGKKPRYLLFVIAVVVALMTGGNGNILSLSLLVLGMFLINSSGKRLSWIKIFFLAMMGIIVLLYEGIEEIISFITDDHYRFSIWNEYFATVGDSVKNIIFGASISNNYILQAYGHLHNSFLDWHFYYGLIPALVFGVSIIKSIFYSFKKRKYFYLMFLIVTIIRSFTDEATLILLPIWVFFECERRMQE